MIEKFTFQSGDIQMLKNLETLNIFIINLHSNLVIFK